MFACAAELCDKLPLDDACRSFLPSSKLNAAVALLDSGWELDEDAKKALGVRGLALVNDSRQAMRMLLIAGQQAKLPVCRENHEEACSLVEFKARLFQRQSMTELKHFIDVRQKEKR